MTPFMVYGRVGVEAQRPEAGVRKDGVGGRLLGPWIPLAKALAFGCLEVLLHGCASVGLRSPMRRPSEPWSSADWGIRQPGGAFVPSWAPRAEAPSLSFGPGRDLGPRTPTGNGAILAAAQRISGVVAPN